MPVPGAVRVVLALRPEGRDILDQIADNCESDPLTWHLNRTELEHIPAWCAEDPVLAGTGGLQQLAAASGTVHGQVFLVRSDGCVLPEVNAFLASRLMRKCSALTQVKYGRRLCVAGLSGRGRAGLG
jgi:hypothetical protein